MSIHLICQRRNFWRDFFSIIISCQTLLTSTLTHIYFTILPFSNDSNNMNFQSTSKFCIGYTFDNFDLLGTHFVCLTSKKVVKKFLNQTLGKFSARTQKKLELTVWLLLVPIHILWLFVGHKNIFLVIKRIIMYSIPKIFL